MDAKRFAELVHSPREAGRVGRGERKPARLAGDDELTVLCEQVVGFFEGSCLTTWLGIASMLANQKAPGPRS